MVHWPLSTQALVRAALDDDAPRVVRLRALASLEHTAEAHRPSVARALVPLLAAPPDVAARAHVALLVLAPTLRLVRAARDDGRDGFDVDDHGRALDELIALFGPGEDPPAFLFPPEAPAPPRYRDPKTLAEQARDEELRALLAARRAADDAVRARAYALGLDDDDLADLDDLDDVALRLRRRFRPLRAGDAFAAFAFIDDRDAFADNGVDVVSLGRLRPGAWATELLMGDHKGARRVRFAVAVDDAPPIVVRRARSLAVKQSRITVTAGHAAVDVDVAGRSVAIFVDEAALSGGARDADSAVEVVGFTLSWSTRV